MKLINKIVSFEEEGIKYSSGQGRIKVRIFHQSFGTRREEEGTTKRPKPQVTFWVSQSGLPCFTSFRKITSRSLACRGSKKALLSPAPNQPDRELPSGQDTGLETALLPAAPSSGRRPRAHPQRGRPGLGGRLAPGNKTRPGGEIRRGP